MARAAGSALFTWPSDFNALLTTVISVAVAILFNALSICKPQGLGMRNLRCREKSIGPKVWRKL